MRVGDRAHFFWNGILMNCIVTEVLPSGLLVLSQGNGRGRMTRTAKEVRPGWLMMGAPGHPPSAHGPS